MLLPLGFSQLVARFMDLYAPAQMIDSSVESLRTAKPRSWRKDYLLT